MTRPPLCIAARAAIPQVRLLRHSFRSGQSAAVTTGVRHARAEWVGTLDGDGQNDPADLPKLLAARLDPANADVVLFQGHRTTRKDTGFRRLQSRIANGVRSRLLGDGTPDTGCGIKVMQPCELSGAAEVRSHASLPAGAVPARRRRASFPCP